MPALLRFVRPGICLHRTISSPSLLVFYFMHIFLQICPPNKRFTNFSTALLCTPHLGHDRNSCNIQIGLQQIQATTTPASYHSHAVYYLLCSPKYFSLICIDIGNHLLRTLIFFLSLIRDVSHVLLQIGSSNKSHANYYTPSLCIPQHSWHPTHRDFANSLQQLQAIATLAHFWFIFVDY